MPNVMQLTTEEYGEIYPRTHEDCVVGLNSRPYDSQNPNGMGYLVLEKDKTFASQVTAANTIYEIRYDFALAANFTMPAGCTLRFNGGSLSGAYTITGNGTKIEAGITKIFNTDITFSGDWAVEESFPEWFGAIPNVSTVDSRGAIQKCLDSFSVVRLNGQYYLLSNNNGVGIAMPDRGRILGNNYGRSYMVTSNMGDAIRAADTSITKIIVVGTSCEIKNIHLHGHHTSDWQTNQNDLFGIYSDTIESRVNIEDVAIWYCKYGIYAMLYLSTISRSMCASCIGGMYITGDSSSELTSIRLDNCYCQTNSEFGYRLEKVIYSSLSSCACDDFGTTALASTYYGAYSFIYCKGITVTGCGVERCVRPIYVYNSASVVFLGCRFTTNISNFSASQMLTWIFAKNVQGCVFNISYEISGTISGWSGKLFTIEDYRKENQICTISGVSPMVITVTSTGSGVTSADIWKCVNVKTKPFASYPIANNTDADSKIVSYNYLNNTVEITTEGDTGTIRIGATPNFVDIYGTEELVFNGKGVDNTIILVNTSTILNTFSGFRKITFRNLTIQWPDVRSVEGMKFSNCGLVEFIDCKIKNPANQSAFILDGTRIVLSGSTHFFSTESNMRNVVGDVSGIVDASMFSSYFAYKFLPIGVSVKLSNGYYGDVKSATPRVVIAQFYAATLADLKSITNALSANEKTLISGSRGIVAADHKEYVFDNSAWYLDGTAV